jgi:transmembrane sensor
MRDRQRDMIEAEAIQQFLRLREPDERIRRASEFSEWLTRSPAHVEAFLAVVMTWGAVNVPAAGEWTSDALILAARSEQEASNLVALPQAPVAAAERPRPQPRRLWWAVAASALLALGGWLGYAIVSSIDVYRNAGAEVQRVTLPDGSLVSLSPKSEIYLRWTSAERRLELRQGRARFQVAKNPQRPFLVDTDYGSVRAVGTVFDVDAQGQEMRVTVLEGKVAVESDTPAGVGRSSGGERYSPLQLSAGDRATIKGGDLARPAEAAPSVMAWTGRRVVFRGATLATVIDEFNRYQDRAVIIDDSGLATLVISGVFDPGNPESLLAYLQLVEGVRVSHAADGTVLLVRRQGG